MSYDVFRNAISTLTNATKHILMSSNYLKVWLLMNS